MKLRKKRKKDLNNKYNIKKSVLILTMLICIIIAMITYWIYAYHHKYGDLGNNDVNLVSHKISDYLEIKGNVVYLKNMDENIIENFTELQQNILLDNKMLNTDIRRELYKNKLSVIISYAISNESEIILSLNVDLKNNKIIENDDLLNIVGVSYRDIATNIYDDYIKLPSDYNDFVVDAVTEKKLTHKEFNNDSEKYIIRIREKLPDIINLYIEDGKLYYMVNLEEIYKICYYTNTDKLVNISKELGRI